MWFAGGLRSVCIYGSASPGGSQKGGTVMSENGMLQNERVLTFAEAAKALPRVNGKRPHTSTLWRWARKGCRGVYLEVRRFGGRYVTSIEALDRFGEQLAAADRLEPLKQRVTPDRPTTRTPAQKEKDVMAAEKTLREAGVIQ